MYVIISSVLVFYRITILIVAQFDKNQISMVIIMYTKKLNFFLVFVC